MATVLSVAKNVSANYFGIGVRAVVFLALTPFVVRHLGTTAYAVWILVHTISFYLKFLDLGLYSALIKYLAEYAAARRQAEVNNLIANVLGAFFIAGLVALALSAVVAVFLVPLFHQIPEELVPAFQAAVILIGVDLLISFPGSVCNGIFEGHQRYDILNYTGSAFLVVRSVGTVVLLLRGYGIVSLAVLEVMASVLGVLVDLCIIRRLFPEIRWSVRFFHPRTWRSIRQYSLWSSLNEILVEGAAELDKVLIPFFLSVTMLTPYGIVCSLAALLRVIIEPLTDVLFPMASEQQARRDRQGLQKAMVLSTKAALASTLPGAIVLATMGDALIDLWIGAGYVQVPPGLLPILLASFMVTVFFMPATTMLAGMARLKEIFTFSVIETVLAVVLVSLTARRYELIGLAASCAIANFVISFGCILPFACRELRVETRRYLHEGLIRPLIAAIPATLVAHALIGRWYPDTWLVLALQGGAVVTAYFTGFYFFSISRSERAFFIYRARQVLADAF